MAIGLPRIKFANLGVSPAGPWNKSPLHYYGKSVLLPLNNLFLSHLLTTTSRTLPPCRQHQPTPLITLIISAIQPVDWLDLLAVQGTLKGLLQHHSSQALIVWCQAFFIVRLSHSYMTTRKTSTLTRWNFVDKVIPLLFNMLPMLLITFLPRSKWLFASWLQSSSTVILEPPKIKSVIVSTVSSSFPLK